MFERRILLQFLEARVRAICIGYIVPLFGQRLSPPHWKAFQNPNKRGDIIPAAVRWRGNRDRLTRNILYTW